MDGSGNATHTLHVFQGLDPLGVSWSASNKMQDKSDTYILITVLIFLFQSNQQT
jgi:hypothetical protein